MKTKNIWILITFLACTSCKEDPQPTSFQGVVVYEDDGARLTNGRMTISSEGNSKNIGAGPNVIDVKIISLDSGNGEFNVMFNANEDVIDYQIVIQDFTRTDASFVFIDECGSIACNGIKPGKAYENLVIEVPRQ
ncbi:MAG TPA: hypothetical protein ACFCUD_12435 [Cyclobacteriaceae bacterium]